MTAIPAARFPVAARMARQAAPLAVAAVLSACGIDQVGNPFSGGASMRIDVEVYKGPLSKEPEVQFEELRAILREVVTGVTTFNDRVLQMAVAKGYVAVKDSGDAAPLTVDPHFRIDLPREDRKYADHRSVSKVGGKSLFWKRDKSDKNEPRPSPEIEWCAGSKVRESMSSESTDAAFGECLTFAHLYDDVQHLKRIIYRLAETADDPAQPKSIPETFGEIVKLSARAGTQFKMKAFAWAGGQMVAPSSDRATRLLAVSFANLAAEYGNQIAARADTLLKQCRGVAGTTVDEASCRGIHRERLPLSVYLREINPTEFVNMFIYNRAVAPPITEEILTRPFWALGSQETTDRVRVIEHLFADHNWSRINTVHANGQGEVRMAFIKDDIGNWNLKSFSNDPTELVEGYKKISLAAVSAASRLAADIGTGGGASGLEKALSLAGRAARGRLGPASPEAAGINLDALAGTVGRQIDDTARRGKDAESKIKDDDKPKENEKKSGQRKQTYGELYGLLRQYDGMLESLQAAVAAQAAPDAPNPKDYLPKAP